MLVRMQENEIGLQGFFRNRWAGYQRPRSVLSKHPCAVAIFRQELKHIIWVIPKLTRPLAQQLHQDNRRMRQRFFRPLKDH